MKKLSPELQKVYDYLEFQKQNADKAAEQTEDTLAQLILTTQSTAFWQIQTFINVNFVEEDGELVFADKE